MTMPRDVLTLLGGEVPDEPLMKQALTHRSAAGEHNERLEFLGDAILGAVISTALYHRFPSFEEGELTRLRSYLVREQSLADIARAIELPRLIRIGQGEAESGGRQRDALSADTLEAVIGALYLIKGMDKATDFISELFDERLQSLPAPEELKDSKTRLQEYLQARGHPLPVYEVGEKTSHDVFCVVCKVACLGIELHAQATSKRKAEQRAAAAVLERLQSSSCG